MKLLDPADTDLIPIFPRGAYLHIPFCRRRCFYCDFPISVIGSRTSPATYPPIQDYVDLLCREIALSPSSGDPLKTVFFGGGTPSLLPVSALEQILASLDHQLGIDASAEISMEIDPGTFDRKQLLGYRQLGVNRFSLGVQAFQDELLQTCGRSHSLPDSYAAIGLLQDLGIENYSFDLISGLPAQTLNHWQASLKKAIALHPHHLSCYDLVLEPGTAFGKRYQAGATPLPDDDLTARCYRLARTLLTQAGYEHYEISNYALPGYQCRHNRLYWENQPFYGFGMGAASFTDGKRMTRPRTRQGYAAWVDEFARHGGRIDTPEISQGDRLLDTLMLGLRLAEGLSLSSLARDFGESAVETLIQASMPYERQGWVQVMAGGDSIPLAEWRTGDRLQLSDPDGFLFSNTILASLFAALER